MGEYIPLKEVADGIEVRVYTSRWLALFLFCIVSFINSLEWICFSTIRQVASAGIQCSLSEIDLLSTIYMMVYLIAPLLSSTQSSMSIRGNVLCGAVLTTLGSLIRFLASSYWQLLLGQGVCALAQTFTLALPSCLSATFFPLHERGVSTGVAVVANQGGIAIAFLLGPFMVPDASSLGDYLLLQLITSSGITLLVVLLFPGDPAYPPSLTGNAGTLKRQYGQFSVVFRNLKDSVGFISLFILYGILTAVFYGWSTFLQVLCPHLSVQEVGWCGFVSVLSGLFGSLVFPSLAHKTKTFKAITLFINLCSVLGMTVFFVLSFHENSISTTLTFLCSSFLGIAMTGVLSLGLEYAVELTFPVQELTSAVLLTWSAQAFGIVVITSLSLSQASVTVMYMTFIILLVISFFLTMLLPNILNRHLVENSLITV